MDPNPCLYHLFIIYAFSNTFIHIFIYLLIHIFSVWVKFRVLHMLGNFSLLALQHHSSFFSFNLNFSRQRVITKPRLPLNLWSSCFHLQSSGITMVKYSSNNMKGYISVKTVFSWLVFHVHRGREGLLFNR